MRKFPPNIKMKSSFVQRYWQELLALSWHLHPVSVLSMQIVRDNKRNRRIREINNGNFLSVIELLGRCDSVWQRFITSKSKTKYWSPEILNEMISIMAQNVQDEIVKEIHEAGFSSIIMDTTQDISTVNQLSQVIWYVTILKDEHDNPSQVKIHEGLVGFHAVCHHPQISSSTNLYHVTKTRRDAT